MSHKVRPTSRTSRPASNKLGPALHTWRASRPGRDRTPTSRGGRWIAAGGTRIAAGGPCIHACARPAAGDCSRRGPRRRGPPAAARPHPHAPADDCGARRAPPADPCRHGVARPAPAHGRLRPGTRGAGRRPSGRRRAQEGAWDVAAAPTITAGVGVTGRRAIAPRAGPSEAIASGRRSPRRPGRPPASAGGDAGRPWSRWRGR